MSIFLEPLSLVYRFTFLSLTGGQYAEFHDYNCGWRSRYRRNRRLISSDKVVGTAVCNRQGEHLGSVYNLMVDKISGQIAYAVMSFGGFLGIGESYHPLPWRVLKYDIRQGGYVVDLDRRRLEGAPSYTASNLPNWSDRAFDHRVDDITGCHLTVFELLRTPEGTATASGGQG